MADIQATVLCEEPLIIYTAQIESVRCAVRVLASELAQKRTIFLCRMAWSSEVDAHLDSTIKHFKEHNERYPNHTLYAVCNTQREVERYRARGVNAIFGNHNAFCDPKIFKIVDNKPKSFSAVYNAQLSPWKRHTLASKIDKVAFLYHSFSDSQASYLEKIRKDVPGARFINEERPRVKQELLSSQEVCELLNECKVGLVLSSVEGANHSSIEYLLCGLPVVSTKSLGGRDLFFDETNSLIVSDDPDAIAKGVQHFVEHPVSPHIIRDGAIQKQKEVAGAFLDGVNGILRAEGSEKDIHADWPKFFRNKMMGWEDSADFIRRGLQRLR